MKTLIAIALFSLSSFCHAQNDYERSKFGSGWIDIDGDCQDTRQEVLIRDSVIPVTLSKDKCKVKTGLWICPYTGRIITKPGDVDIDHVVPLMEVYTSGAEHWPLERRIQYANDLTSPNTLLATYNIVNRSKGERDPSTWMPPNIHYWPVYIQKWTDVKKTWNLNMDSTERETITKLTTIAENMKKGIKVNTYKNQIMIE